MKKIAVFASGSGSNAQKIIEYFSNNDTGEVALVLSNSKDAYVLERAKSYDIPTLVFSKQALYETNEIINILQEHNIDIIVLAGFLLLIPVHLIRAFPDKIINIHPALLPKYGGKGMYGLHVHKAVLDNNEKKSGITIHYVNEEYDKGEIIFQATCTVLPDDTPESLANRIHALEHEHYPYIVEQVLRKQV